MRRIPTFDEFLIEGKIDMFTIMIGKHKDGHKVMSVNYWDEERHLNDYIDSYKRGQDKIYKATRNELESKISELQKDNGIKDQNVFRNY